MLQVAGRRHVFIFDLLHYHEPAVFALIDELFGNADAVKLGQNFRGDHSLIQKCALLKIIYKYTLCIIMHSARVWCDTCPVAARALPWQILSWRITCGDEKLH